jgi:hypothetical protein
MLVPALAVPPVDDPHPATSKPSRAVPAAHARQ